jgi:hypothetical protein
MAMNELGPSVQESVGTELRDLGARIGPQIEEAKRRLRSINSQATQVISDHPAACLLGALGLGYLIARLARRQSS